MPRPVRIANCSGFYGDRLAAAREMLAGPIDVEVLAGARGADEVVGGAGGTIEVGQVGGGGRRAGGEAE